AGQSRRRVLALLAPVLAGWKVFPLSGEKQGSGEKRHLRSAIGVAGEKAASEYPDEGGLCAAGLFAVCSGWNPVRSKAGPETFPSAGRTGFRGGRGQGQRSHCAQRL